MSEEHLEIAAGLVALVVVVTSIIGCAIAAYWSQGSERVLWIILGVLITRFVVGE